jgi:2-polyprenyl-3-methyl-5-hydroxy-6-metoxy-1,4-benzoquinol methylase
MTQPKNFDAVAAQWDDEPRRVKLAEDVAAAMKDAVPLSREWDALDFGCGTGLVTLQLAPSLRSITGVDSSSGMLERLAAKVAASGIENVRTRLYDPAKGEFPSEKYHLITSAMTLHHVEHVAPLLQSLKTLLHPGGWIALADLAAEEGRFHEDATGVFHNGFSSEEFSALLERAGFDGVSIGIAINVVKGGSTFPVLLATAQSC